MKLSRWSKQTMLGICICLTLLPFQNCSFPQFKLAEQASLASFDSSSFSIPTINVANAPEITNSSNLTINFSVAVAGTTTLKSVNCNVNSQAAQDCMAGSFAVSNMSDGDFLIKIVAETTSGVKREKMIVVRKDSVVPVLTVSSAPASITNQTSASFSFLATDNLSGVLRVECSLDNAAFSACTSPANLTSLAAGSHSFRARAVDRANNVSAVYSHMWMIDLSALNVNITSNPPSVTNSLSANFSFSGAGFSSYQCQIDNGAYATCTSPHVLSSLTANVPHIFRVRGVAADGTMSSSAQYMWTVDNIAPNIPTIMASIQSFTKDRNPTFSFSSQDALAGIARFECSHNSSAFASCTSPQARTNLIDGNYVLQLRAVDNASNISPVASFSYQVDTVAPTLSYSQTPMAQATATTATLVFAAADANSGIKSIQCSLDSSAFTACTSPVSLSNLAIGSHSHRVQVYDNADNISLITHTWSVAQVSTPESRLADAKDVMSRNCTGCHAPGAFAVSFDYATDQQFVESGLVVAGSLERSKLIFRLRNYPVNIAGRNMPPSAPISDADYAKLAAWVQNMPGAVTAQQNYFACDQNEAPDSLNAKRLSKPQVYNTLMGLVSRAIGSAEATTLLSSNAAFFTSRVPNDAQAPFSKGDDNFSSLHAKAYFDIADELSTALVDQARYSRFVSTYINYNRGMCSFVSADNLSAICREVLIRNFVLRAWGRPIEDNNNNLNNELASFQQEFNLASNTLNGVNSMIFKTLTSPAFLFHVMSDVVAQAGNTYRLSNYAIARRLAFNYMQSNLDEGLLGIAQSQDLSTDAGFMSALNYVSSRTNSTVREFTNEWLKIYNLPTFSNQSHPRFQLIAQNINLNDNLRNAMRDEIFEMVNYVDTNNRPVTDLLTSNVSFARNPDLMRIYGQATAAPAIVTEQNAVRFPAAERSGLLTRSGYIFSGSYTDRLVMRGVHAREQFLCLELSGTAPAGATTTPLSTDDNMTSRQKYEAVTSAASCVGCHSQINPVGFAFSQYNSLGGFQTSESIFNSSNQFVRYLPTDAVVNLQTVFGISQETRTAVEFSQVTSQSQDFKRCMTQQYYSYFHGLRDRTKAQNSCSMQRMYQVIDSGGSLKDFFRSASQDPKFRLRNLVK